MSRHKSDQVSLRASLYFWCFYDNNAYPETEVHCFCNAIIHLLFFFKPRDWHACIHCCCPSLVFSNDPHMYFTFVRVSP